MLDLVGSLFGNFCSTLAELLGADGELRESFASFAAGTRRLKRLGGGCD